MMRVRSLLLSLMAVFPGALFSNQQAAAQSIHYVDNLGDCAGRAPCHPAIADAVTAALPFDSIEVFPGVYPETVVFEGAKDHITLRAYASALRPVIAGIILRAPGVQARNFFIEGGVTAEGLNARNAVLHGNRIGNVRFFGCFNSTVSKNRVVGGLAVEIADARGCVFEGNIVDGGLRISSPDFENIQNVVRSNVVRGGILLPDARVLLGATIESNLVEEGSIALSCVRQIDGNLVRHNVVRGGGIELRTKVGRGDSSRNYILGNFVSDSSGDGIAIHSPEPGNNVIRGNTSVENAGCDLRDGTPAPHQNTWTDNRFRTKCGIPVE